MSRRPLAAALALLTCMLAALVGVGSPARAAMPQTIVKAASPAGDGSEDVATCLQSARSLSALFLFDRSGSLSSSDPNDIRYDGLKVALQSLSRVTRPDGADVAIEVAVSAFDNNYYKARNVVEWTRINDGNDDDVSETIDEVIKKAKERTSPDGGTNFTSAMEGAFDDLKDRGSQGTCRVVFWFTDGADESGAVAGDSCRADSGVVDQMRQAGIVIVGLQLWPSNIIDPRPDDLEAMSIGKSPTLECGRNPIPTDWARGVFIRADDSAALRRLFGTLGNIVNGCAPQGDRGGKIDPGVRAMNVTIHTPKQVKAVRLDAPDGTIITAAPRGSTTQGGYTTLAQSDDSYVSLTVDFPPGEGAGEWTVSAGQAVASDDIEFCVFSGLHLTRADPKAAPKAGKEGEFVYQAVDKDGNVADLSVYKDVAVGASVAAANGDIRKATAERVGDQIVVRFKSEATDARLQVQLTAQLTTISGVDLTPLAIDEGVGLTLSKAFPTISPIDQLDLGAAINTQPASATLTLVGSPMGASQVCFEKPTQIVVPEEASGAALDVQRGCVDLAQAETKTVTVSITPDDPTVGNGEAILPIRLVPVVGSEMDGQEALVNLPVIWRYENPRDPVVLVAVLVIASLLSVALPLIALGLANFLTARFQVSGLRGEVIPVVIGEDGPRRIEPLEGNPTAVIESYKTSVVPTTGRRKFRYGPVELVSKAYLSPLKAPTFLVRPIAAGYRVLSSVPPPTADGTVANASPGLGFLAIAVISEADLKNPSVGEVPAQLVVLVRDTSVASANLDPIMNSKIDWRVVTERWREGVDVRPGSTGGDDSTSGTTSFSHLDGGSNASTLDLGSMGHLDLGDD